MGNGENSVSPIFHQTNRWRGETSGHREGERKRRIEGGKEKNISSTMHHAQQQRVGYGVGGKGALGSPM